MDRNLRPQGSPLGGGHRDRLEASLAGAAVLLEPVRRRIFQFVRSSRGPVTRDDAAAAVRVSRSLAAFHLDKLVQAGLLRAGSPPSPGPGRVGRRPKQYEVGAGEVSVSVPERRHGLLAEVLLEAVRHPEAGEPVRRSVLDAAERHGEALGRDIAAREARAVAGTSRRVHAALEDLGFEPYADGAAALRLRNCPFHPLAAREPELVCGLNHRLVAGVLTGMRARDAAAVLAPRPGECCVEVRLEEPPAAPAGG